MNRKIGRTLAALLLIATACARSPNAPPNDATNVAIGKNATPSPVSPGMRSASATITRAWPFAKPEIALYADLDGLFAREFSRGVFVLLKEGFREMRQSVNGAATDTSCADTAFASAKELAFGNDEGGELLIVRFDPPSAFDVCVKSFRGDERSSLELRDGLLLYGSKALVAKALAGAGGGDSSFLTLAQNRWVEWRLALPKDGIEAHGGLTVTRDTFSLDARADLPPVLADEAEQKAAESRAVLAQGGEAMKPLLAGFTFARDGGHIRANLEIKGTEAELAQAVGGAAIGVAIYGVREYIANAKLAEARNVLAQLARDYATYWESEPAPGMTPAKKKMLSFPAVPKSVPRAVKYASTPEDWKPWAPLQFSMATPQYFQYEIVAAKDGDSAEIRARGDLNGDGKTSLLKLTLTVDRAHGSTISTGAIEEKDPRE